MEVWVEILGHLKMDKRIKFGRVCQAWNRTMPLRIRALDLRFESGGGGNGMWSKSVGIDKALNFLLPLTGEKLRAFMTGKLSHPQVDLLIHHCPNLNQLRMYKIDVAQAGRLASGSLKKLRVEQLLLDDNAATLHIKRFLRIQHIEVDRRLPSRIVDFFVSEPINAFGFRKVDIDVTTLTPKMFSVLILQCPLIEDFRLYNGYNRQQTQSDFDLSKLKHLTQLRRLRLFTFMVLVGLEEVFSAQSATLESFHGCGRIINDYKFLAHGVNLKRLMVDNVANVPVSFLSDLPERAPLTYLKLIIAINGADDIAQVFATLAKKCYPLKQLELRFCGNVSRVDSGATGLGLLLSVTPTLRSLSIKGLAFHGYVRDDLLAHAKQLEELVWSSLDSEEYLLAFLSARRGRIQRGVHVSLLSLPIL